MCSRTFKVRSRYYHVEAHNVSKLLKQGILVRLFCVLLMAVRVELGEGQTYSINSISSKYIIILNYIFMTLLYNIHTFFIRTP